MNKKNIENSLINVYLPIDLNVDKLIAIPCPICNRKQYSHFSKITINNIDIFLDYCSKDDIWWVGTRPDVEFYNNLYSELFYTSPLPEQFGYASLKSGTSHRSEKAKLNWDDIEKNVNYCTKNSFLEIGCSTGEMLQEGVERGWKKVTGIEIDSDSCEIALSNGLNVMHESFEEMKCLDIKFNLIFSDNVIEHLFNPIDSIKKCFSMQALGGCLVLRLPETPSVGPTLKLIDHTYHYTRKSINLLLSMCGYKVDKIFFSGSYFSKDKVNRIDNMTVVAYKL